MGRPANTEKAMENVQAEEVKTEKKKYKTLDEYRKNARIAIMLPVAHGDEESYLYEFVTVNGLTTQIRRGEKVKVNWLVYEELTNPMTGKFPRSILA